MFFVNEYTDWVILSHITFRPPTNNDETSKRRVIVFWLINPEKKILSTKSVVDNRNITYQQAIAYRLELMEERKRKKQDWNVREISLCEH